MQLLLGTFNKADDGYNGDFRALGIDERVSFVLAEPGNVESAPDWRIHLGENGEGPKIGDGWNHVGERAGPYISLELDSPILPHPMRAWLFKSMVRDDEHELVWNRSRSQDAGAN